MASIILDSNTNKVQGDFDSATLANRTTFQTSTLNANTGVNAVPNGTGTIAGWGAVNNSNPTNASTLQMIVNGSTDTEIISGVNGSGTYLPLGIYTNNTQRLSVTTTGALVLGTGTSNYGTSGQVLTSSGNGVPTWSTTANFRTRNLTSGTTYTPTAAVKSFYAFVYGATGGRNTGGNGGNGGAGYSETYYTSPSGSYTYAIGAAGTTSGTAGGTTTFGAMSVTGSAGVTSNTGSSGGVGSGGTFNATGGAGGNGDGTRGGGGGGAGTRAGVGGTGATQTGTTGGGGGGTGGNNASGGTGGAAATSASGSALDLSTTLGTLTQSWDSGNTATSTPGRSGATGNQTQDIVFIWNAAGSAAANGGSNSATAIAGDSGRIMIIELL
jgi:hypothetical protein